MSRIALSPNASGTGVFTISSPATNTDRSLTLPDEAGTVLTSASSITQNAGPAFSAYLSTNQSISTGVTTKINLDVEEFDTNNNFASSRFTPTVAGYYQLNASAYTYPSSGTIQTAEISIYKNGTAYKTINVTTASTQSGFNVSSLVYTNGTTDYFELYVRQWGTSPTVINGSVYTFFNGAMVRAA